MYAYNPQHESCKFLVMKPDYNLILIKQKYISEENALYSFFDDGINNFFDEVSWIHPESMEDLEGVLLEESKVLDTRKIF